MRYAMQSVSKKVLKNERVSMCLRYINKNQDVAVWKHRKTEKAFYNGLLVCGSVWTCPVCAAKISEKRRKELKQVFDAHKATGGSISMLTITFSHRKHNRLADILDKFSKANTKFMTGRAFHQIREEMGIIGRVRALEVTYGENGFHPHAHIALFHTEKLDEDELEVMRKRMFVLWEKACTKFGLSVKEEYGLDLQTAENADSYFTKQSNWSLDQELTKFHIKKAKNDAMSPFDFLRTYLETGEGKYLRLFREYAECFKGKRQLQWSPGLKKLYAIEERTDEELAQEKTETADLLGMLDYEFWKEILAQNNSAYFLDLCEQYSFDEAVSVICDIAYSRKKSQAFGEA